MISDTIVLRAARETEISKLNEHLAEAYGSYFKLVVPFDQELIEIEKNGSKKTIYSESAKPRWWVVEFTGSNQQIHELSKTALLLSPKIHFGSSFLYSGSDLQADYLDRFMIFLVQMHV